MINKFPMPACVVGENGNIVKANDLMDEVFVYSDIIGANFFALTGVKKADICEANKTNKEILIERNDRTFALAAERGASPDEEVTVFFIDRTDRELYCKSFENVKPVLLIIDIDNYEELTSKTTTDSRRAIPTEVDRIVRKWADSFDAAIMSVAEDEYVVFTNREKAHQMTADNFSVLDEVRQIETKIDFPVSISIGMGISDISIAECKDLALAGLELAIGRGGDQAIVKTDETTDHYGGTLQTMEKNKRGKARVIAHAIKRLIKESSKVVIMGHRMPDMDSFGAALGAYRMCEYMDTDAYIVIEEHNDALEEIYTSAVESEEYRFIKRQKAIDIVDEKTLCFVVDTNRPRLVECPELLEKCKKVIVVDHHRLADDAIEAPTIAYVESYASSASELITEVMQYFAQKKFITKFEAEALLAGIMVDTNSYSVRSGVRTFEAAAWLKRAGADTASVKKLFQTDIEDFRLKANAIAAAEYTPDGFAFAKTDCFTADAAIINAQVADSLLTVKGVIASFVIGRNEKMQTIISARSLGEVNVQTLMEKLGGGGHLTAAAAQLDITPEEARAELDKLLKKMKENNSEEE